MPNLTISQEHEVRALVKTLDLFLTAMERSPIPASIDETRERDLRMSAVRRDLFEARGLLSDNSTK